MVALKADTHVLLDGAVKVYKRGNSRLWQATFKIDQHWVRISTGQQNGVRPLMWSTNQGSCVP